MKILELPEYYQTRESDYLKQDSTLTKYAVLIYGLAILLFGYFDYLLFKNSGSAVALFGVRAVVIVSSIALFIYLSRSKDHKYYSMAVFLWWLLLLFMVLYVDFMRPKNYLHGYGLRLVVGVTIYMIVRNKLILQIIPAVLFSVASLVQLFFFKTVPTPLIYISYTVVFFALNIMGIAVSYMLTKHRCKELEYKNQQKEMKKQLEMLAFTDELTGIFNRRRIIEHLEDEFRRTKRYKNKLTVMMLDIDHFKGVNDGYGHDIGDTILVRFSNILYAAIRSTDFIGRLGGEEFLIIFPETSVENSLFVANRINRLLNENKILIEGESFSITASMGITSVRVEDESACSCVKRADEFMYKAKNGGRNQFYSDLNDKLIAV